MTLEDFKLLCGVMASVLAIVCYVPYIRDTLARRTQPHIYTWLVWTILQIIGGVAVFEEGGDGWAVCAFIVSVALCGVIFVLSFWYGTKDITRSDGVCLGLALAALLMYLSLHELAWAVLLATSVDTIGFIPTIRKGYLEPHTETVSFFLISALCYVLILLSLEHYTFSSVFFSAWIGLTDLAFALMLVYRRKANNY